MWHFYSLLSIENNGPLVAYWLVYITIFITTASLPSSEWIIDLSRYKKKVNNRKSREQNEGKQKWIDLRWESNQRPLKYSSPMIQKPLKELFWRPFDAAGLCPDMRTTLTHAMFDSNSSVVWWLSELEGEMRRLWAVGPCWSCFARPWKQCCSLARPVLSASLSPNTYTHTQQHTL